MKTPKAWRHSTIEACGSLQVDLKEGDGEVAASQKPDECLQPMSASQRNQLLSTLPADSASATAAADKALNSTDPTVQFLQHKSLEH